MRRKHLAISGSDRLACRTIDEVRDELERRGVRMSRMGVHKALKRAEQKLRDGLRPILAKIAA